MLAAARPAVQRAEVRVVVGLAAVSAQHDEAAEASGQPDGAEPAFDDVGLLCSGEPARARTGGGRLRGRRAGAVRGAASTATRVATGERNQPSRVCETDSWRAGASVLPASPALNEKPRTSTSMSDDKRVLLEVVEQLVDEPKPAGARGVALQRQTLIGPHRLVDRNLGREQHRAQREPLVAVERLVVASRRRRTRHSHRCRTDRALRCAGGTTRTAHRCSRRSGREGGRRRSSRVDRRLAGRPAGRAAGAGRCLRRLPARPGRVPPRGTPRASRAALTLPTASAPASAPA